MKRIPFVFIPIGALLLGSCAGGDRVRGSSDYEFPEIAATVPSPQESSGLEGLSPAKPGDSKISLEGALDLQSTADFDCVTAPGPGDQRIDDFFVDGILGYLGGEPLSLRMNVEFYTGPGTYKRTGQVLLRVVEFKDDPNDPYNRNAFYASWYFGYSTVRVDGTEEEVILEPVSLKPEPGTDAKGSIRIGGTFACDIWRNK